MKILIPLIKKEILQIIRDPSTIIIAFILPFVSMLIYMYGISLDSVHVTIGIKNDNPNMDTAALVNTFDKNEYVSTLIIDNEAKMASAILRNNVHGCVVIPNDFCTRLSRSEPADLQLITDGAETNTANYIYSYTLSIVNQWLSSYSYAGTSKTNIVTANIRNWYNPTLDSHHFILPGSIAVTMTFIGILVTALVVAREWERGTMESLLSTRVKAIHIVIAKYIPYYFVAMTSMIFNFILTVFFFNVPFRGNFLVLFLVSTLFVFDLLGVGLTISTYYKNQFLASMLSMGIGFMPALMLSGLLFPINSMPEIFQWLTYLLPPRYFSTFILSEFLAGTVPELVLLNSIFLTFIGIVLFSIVYYLTPSRLEQ